MSRLNKPLVLVLLVLATPAVVFLTVALLSGLPVSDTISALTSQFATRKQNLGVAGLLGLFPLLLMGLILWLRRKFFNGNPRLTSSIVLGGFIPLLAVLLWANIEYWTDFLPARVAPGFPHGLELVIGPLIYAPVASLLGMLLARVVARN